jgi:hypothetical protein
VEETLRRLLEQAYLFDDPAAYAAGVRDASDALARAQTEEPPAEQVGVG